MKSRIIVVVPVMRRARSKASDEGRTQAHRLVLAVCAMIWAASLTVLAARYVGTSDFAIVWAIDGPQVTLSRLSDPRPAPTRQLRQFVATIDNRSSCDTMKASRPWLFA